MATMTLSGGGTSNRLLAAVSDGGSKRGVRFRNIKQRWQWQGGGPPVDLVPAADTLGGLALVSATASFEEGSAFYQWRYESVTADSYAQYAGSGTSSTVQASVNRSPITSHIEFGKWIGYRNPETGKRYGRVVRGEVIWEAEDPTGSSGRSGLTKDGDSVSNLNPFYGINDFFDIGATHIEEEPMNKGQLTSLFDKVGTIDDPPGSAVVGGQNDRNWLYVGASAEQVGTTFLVRRTWLLSGPGGWEPAIYSQ
jgi:hypothetical protein